MQAKLTREEKKTDARKHLAPFRKKIDALDDRIVKLLGRRFEIVRKVAVCKAQNGLAVVQGDRVREVKERNAETARKYGVSPELVRAIYTLIIDEAHDMESKNSTKPRA